ncbi:hypothetical protein [Phyllobacterium zundukense]|uniref:Uncharacterized protein n=1 Tax=Phyllobacterium zundukense TaxID=1867719 RepID=A0A2N9VY84_9HYPH|nr:hypothetical protein [Phyllobacterium zundukense]ATU94089.1 hypothetical protein BLM14_20110 [Phyllobacterium zundukense]PIO44452.1 hypothetical protein B5P45_12900 [Phyllobacterium zundukense]
MTITIRTLGQAAKYRMFLQVCCRKCQKETTFYAPDLLEVCNPECFLVELPFRCDRCGARATDVMAFEDDRDRVNKKRTVWRPVQM